MMSILTTHMPFHAAMRVEIPMKNPTNGRIRQERAAEDKVIRMAAIKLMMMVMMPKLRAKIIRGWLPLHIVHLMKFGWAWCRSVHSTVACTCPKADGCVVISSA